MIELPEKFCENMKELLGEEYENYWDSFQEKSYSAIRINTNKITLEQWKKINPFTTVQVPWTDKGFYYDPQKETPSKHPYYYAGLYYIQEPSAMIPASILPVTPGDKVLDLCAAPGGKATELGAKLQGKGLLVANDISVSRTVALAKNLTLCGITNSVVTAETPEHLREVFGEYFDKILIDAPCSGEGMFRREPRMVKDWMEKGPEYYSKIQKEILENAYKMLKTGGQMVYSTCTFSVEEDEGVIQWLLQQHEDMTICPVERKEGFCQGRPDMVENGRKELKECVRIFPHKGKGEGHFAVLLQKGEPIKQEQNQSLVTGDTYSKIQKEFFEKLKNEEGFGEKKKTAGKHFGKTGKNPKKKTCQGKKEKGDWQGVSKDQIKVLQEILENLPYGEGKFSWRKNVLMWEPLWIENPKGLRIVQNGVPICQCKHKIVPEHGLALTLTREEYPNVIEFSPEEETLLRYLKGETIMTEKEHTGNILVCVDGYGVGWCQGNGTNVLKNKYHPGWRYQ